MIRLPRWVIFSVATMLVFNPVTNAILGFYLFHEPIRVIVTLVLYSVASISSIFYYKELRMPIGFALVNLLMAMVIPPIVNSAIGLEDRGTFATWYVTGIATLMGITAVRQHKLIAWSGIAILIIHIASWGGASFLFNSGLAGAFGLVVTGHLLSVGLERSSRETMAYLEQAKATEARSAADSAIRFERSKRLAETLAGVLPMLEKIASGNFDTAEREQSRVLEAQLRDEIRGRNLLNARLRESVRSARERGVEVVLLDEGGLDEVEPKVQEELRDRVAQELDAIASGRVTIRAPHADKVKVTFVASRPGTAKPDVFLRL